MNEPIKAMILAAGRGERMRPLTDSVPKPLLEIKGKPLIGYHLEALARAGFNEVVINLSWLGQLIRERLGDGTDYGLSIRYSEEPELLDTAGGIIQALPFLGERFIVVNADIHTDYDFARLKQIDRAAHLVLVENPQHKDVGDFGLHDGVVSNDGDPLYTVSGISQYRRSFFDGLPAGRRSLVPLWRAAADGHRLSGELYRGDWTDVGTAERLQALNS